MIATESGPWSCLTVCCNLSSAGTDRSKARLHKGWKCDPGDPSCCWRPRGLLVTSSDKSCAWWPPLIYWLHFTRAVSVDWEQSPAGHRKQALTDCPHGKGFFECILSKAVSNIASLNAYRAKHWLFCLFVCLYSNKHNVLVSYHANDMEQIDSVKVCWLIVVGKWKCSVVHGRHDAYELCDN